MSASDGTHAVVSLPALDVRSRPDHRSELKSQLLLGEVARRLGAAAGDRWWRIESLTDGYVGWVRTWGLVPASAGRAAGWTRRARGRVVVSYAEVRTRRATGALVSPLFWNGRLIAGRLHGRHRAVELPDGRRGWVPAAAIGSRVRGRLGLAERVSRLLGVPYLWGGRTPLGLDCSAFTQQALSEQGIAIPRDADQQFRSARPLRSTESPRAGDLVFFSAGRGRVEHVGLLMGGGYYAHARGRVRINSLDPGNPLWDQELAAQLRGIGRPGR